MMPRELPFNKAADIYDGQFPLTCFVGVDNRNDIAAVIPRPKSGCRQIRLQSSPEDLEGSVWQRAACVVDDFTESFDSARVRSATRTHPRARHHLSPPAQGTHTKALSEQ